MQPQSYYTEAEYLKMADAAPEGVKLEYSDGVIYCHGQPINTLYDAVAMAGASPAHNLLCGNLIGALKSRTSCRVYPSDQQVQVRSRYVFPDVVLLCGEPTYQNHALINPELIVEVLSSSTQDHDMSRKWEWYTAIASVKEYWMVSSTEIRIIQDVRQSETAWMRHLISGRGAVLQSDHFNFELPLDEAYKLVL